MLFLGCVMPLAIRCLADPELAGGRRFTAVTATSQRMVEIGCGYFLYDIVSACPHQAGAGGGVGAAVRLRLPAALCSSMLQSLEPGRCSAYEARCADRVTQLGVRAGAGPARRDWDANVQLLAGARKGRPNSMTLRARRRRPLLASGSCTLPSLHPYPPAVPLVDAGAVPDQVRW